MTTAENEGVAGRAPVILYAVAFVLLLAALGALLLAVRGFLQDLWPLWLSAGFSVAAVAAAAAALVTARRRVVPRAPERGRGSVVD